MVVVCQRSIVGDRDVSNGNLIELIGVQAIVDSWIAELVVGVPTDHDACRAMIGGTDLRIERLVVIESLDKREGRSK